MLGLWFLVLGAAAGLRVVAFRRCRAGPRDGKKPGISLQTLSYGYAPGLDFEFGEASIAFRMLTDRMRQCIDRGAERGGDPPVPFRPFRVVLGASLQRFGSGGGASCTLRARGATRRSPSSVKCTRAS